MYQQDYTFTPNILASLTKTLFTFLLIWPQCLENNSHNSNYGKDIYLLLIT